MLRRVGDEQVDEEVRGVMRQVQHAIKPLTINDNAREVGNAHNHVEDMDVLVIDQGPRCEQAGPPSSSRVGASFPIAIMCVLKEPKPSHGAREEGGGVQSGPGLCQQDLVHLLGPSFGLRSHILSHRPPALALLPLLCGDVLKRDLHAFVGTLPRLEHSADLTSTVNTIERDPRVTRLLLCCPHVGVEVFWHLLVTQATQKALGEPDGLLGVAMVDVTLDDAEKEPHERPLQENDVVKQCRRPRATVNSFLFCLEDHTPMSHDLIHVMLKGVGEKGWVPLEKKSCMSRVAPEIRSLTQNVLTENVEDGLEVEPTHLLSHKPERRQHSKPPGLSKGNADGFRIWEHPATLANPVAELCHPLVNRLDVN